MIETRKEIIDEIFEDRIDRNQQAILDITQSIETECRKTHDELEAAINTTKSKFRKLDIATLRNELISRKPRILYIDDQANEGWCDIFTKNNLDG
ncbi:MAG: hypothetical protein IPK08_19750 [Bacteroidetes bacterium]|nr:hypothetical protein [Bacteroidota bacterium]